MTRNVLVLLNHIAFLFHVFAKVSRFSETIKHIIDYLYRFNAYLIYESTSSLFDRETFLIQVVFFLVGVGRKSAFFRLVKNHYTF